MSLKSKFKTNSNLANSGVWFSFEENSDGTIPMFKLARQSLQNKKYRQILRDKSKKGISKELDSETEKALLDLFIGAILLDWKFFQPEDDGVNLEFNTENALKVLGNPDWHDFYMELSKLSMESDGYSREDIDDVVKN